jgi:hypothetical protein
MTQAAFECSLAMGELPRTVRAQMLCQSQMAQSSDPLAIKISSEHFRAMAVA